jgi:hypothetical protein
MKREQLSPPICQLEFGSVTVGAKVKGDGIQVVYYQLENWQSKHSMPPSVCHTLSKSRTRRLVTATMPYIFNSHKMSSYRFMCDNSVYGVKASGYSGPLSGHSSFEELTIMTIQPAVLREPAWNEKHAIWLISSWEPVRWFKKYTIRRMRSSSFSQIQLVGLCLTSRFTKHITWHIRSLDLIQKHMTWLVISSNRFGRLKKHMTWLISSLDLTVRFQKHVTRLMG